MAFSIVRVLLNTILLSSLTAIVVAQAGPCHPFPGAVAEDCLELIGNNLRNTAAINCGANGRATLTLRQCSITTKCTAGQAEVHTDDAVRAALSAIGSCAFNDYGSISGYYTHDGVKTCYLFPGNEDSC